MIELQRNLVKVSTNQTRIQRNNKINKVFILKSIAYDKNNRWTLPQNASRDVDSVYLHILIQCESKDYHTNQGTNIHCYRRPPVNSYFLHYFNCIHLFLSNKSR